MIDVKNPVIVNKMTLKSISQASIANIFSKQGHQDMSFLKDIMTESDEEADLNNSLPNPYDNLNQRRGKKTPLKNESIQENTINIPLQHCKIKPTLSRNRSILHKGPINTTYDPVGQEVRLIPSRKYSHSNQNLHNSSSEVGNHRSLNPSVRRRESNAVKMSDLSKNPL